MPGDLVSVEEVVESISPDKTTGLGVGRFVTTLKTYRDADGEVVATQRWRTLRFQPTPAPEEPTALRPAARGQPRQRLLVRRRPRAPAGRPALRPVRHAAPPAGAVLPGVPVRSSGTPSRPSGRGTLYLYVVAHHPRHPAFDFPLLIALVELEEGTRLITNLTGIDPENVVIGMPLEVSWHDADAELTLPLFRPVTDPA